MNKLLFLRVLCVKKVTTRLVLAAFVLAACQRAEQKPDTAQIPAGWFLMGENNERASNGPQRRVYLDAYEIQLTEATRAQFARFVEETGYRASGFAEDGDASAANLPVVGVLWKDAEAYCRWLGMRLPTEAEWEKAARGEDGRLYPWGDEWDPEKANAAEGGPGVELPVGSFPGGASPYGLLDMSGNVAEWVADYYDAAYYSIAPERNPPGPERIMDHVLRGGSFASSAGQATTYFRDSSHSVRPNPRVGFRCAK